MPFPRTSGILLHPTSLPSSGGIGDLGPAAYAFVDFLASAGQGLWQVLPLNPPGLGNSPYSAISAFAGNPLLISLERLSQRGWIAPERVAELQHSAGPADFEFVSASKVPLLREAAQNFLARASGAARARLEEFCERNRSWLEDFILYDALRRRFDALHWNHWPAEFARRDAGALDRFRNQAANELAGARVIQFFFFEQWHALRRYCTEHAVRLVGDIAIFVNLDSVDVWCNPDLFQLDENLEPVVVAGVPPDYFSETGQRWGNPLYRWDVMRERGYDWWIRRLRVAADTFDYIRLDHFRGFEQYWEIPAGEPTAVRGHWVDGPRDDFFLKVRDALGGLPFFAEDLGYITPEVHALRERFGIPRMAVLQFGFQDAGAHTYLPHRCSEDVVIYTGTHDTDTAVGWWNAANETVRRHASAYLGRCEDGMHWAMVRSAMASPASLCVVPMQDVLGLGSEARMNVPSLRDGNWRWRMGPEVMQAGLAAKLAALAEVCDRQPEKFGAGGADDFVA